MVFQQKRSDPSPNKVDGMIVGAYAIQWLCELCKALPAHAHCPSWKNAIALWANGSRKTDDTAQRV